MNITYDIAERVARQLLEHTKPHKDIRPDIGHIQVERRTDIVTETGKQVSGVELLFSPGDDVTGSIVLRDDKLQGTAGEARQYVQDILRNLRRLLDKAHGNRAKHSPIVLPQGAGSLIIPSRSEVARHG